MYEKAIKEETLLDVDKMFDKMLKAKIKYEK